MSQRPTSVRARCFGILASACLAVGALGASSAGHFDRERAATLSGAGQGGEALVVSLGAGKAVSGDTALIPLALFTGGAKVVKVISEITFPAGVISFGGTEPVLSEEMGIEIHAEVVPESKGKELGVLRVEVTSKAELPEGTLVKLKLDVSAAARGGDVVLKHTAQAMLLAGEKVKLAAKDGQIKVSETAVYSCFFYMH